MPQDVAHSVLFAASEVVGFAKTGGLADVVGSLPRALARRGHRCVVMLPLYRSCRVGKIPLEPTEHTFRVNIGYRSVPGRLWRATLPDSDVPVYLVEQAEYYERDDPAQGRGLYQYSLPDGKRSDYADNCERFVFFCRAVMEAPRLLGFWPNVIHANDWQTGLVPVYLQQEYRWKPGYKDVRADEFWARGHMPGYPLLPGVLMCEAAAQLCAYYTFKHGLLQGDFIGFGGLENVRFRSPVRPGDRLVLIGKATRLHRRQTIFNVQGFVGSTMVFHADIIGVPLSRKEET